jgi:hypothetical protein
VTSLTTHFPSALPTAPFPNPFSTATRKVPWVNLKQERIREPGFPGVVKDGSYPSSEGLAFFEMHDPDECITLTLNDDEYKTIVFQVADEESVATLIKQVLPSVT